MSPSGITAGHPSVHASTADQESIHGRFFDWLTTGKNPVGGRLLAFLLVLSIGLGALRLVHLTADTPPWVEPTSAGVYVDEGYKTLSSRNLVLFDDTHWHPLDDYKGWMKDSPITSWAYFLAFRAGGPDLRSARCVVVGCFTLFLATFVMLLRSRYTFRILLAGLLMLGLDGALFFFTRIALIEGPEILFLYGWLICLAFMSRRAVWTPVAGTLAFAPLLAFGVKLSAFVYLAPVLAALLVRALVFRGFPRTRMAMGFAAAALVILGLAAIVSHPIWSARLHFDVVGYATNVLSNPVMYLSPFLFLTAWFCAVHMLWAKPAAVLACPFRTAIVAIVVVGTLLMGLFPYDPPRYYVPILPAYAIVICEWLALRMWRHAPKTGNRIFGILGFAGVVFWVFSAARAFNYFALGPILQGIGARPGLGDFSFILVGFPVALIVSGFILLRKEWFGRRGTAAAAVIVGLGLFVASTGIRVGEFLLSPHHDGDDLRNSIVSRIPAGSSVIGAWAPFFAMGTDLRPLYMGDTINVVDRVPELRPEYFLHCDTPQSLRALAGFDDLAGVSLADPVLEGRYNEHTVVLYPIKYAEDIPTTN